MAMVHGPVNKKKPLTDARAGGAGVANPTRANKPLQINPTAIANVANALRGSGLGGGNGAAVNPSSMNAGGAMGAPNPMQSMSGGGAMMPGAPTMTGGSPGVSPNIETAIGNLKGQLGMDPAKPSPMQSLPSSINGRAGLSPSGLPPRLQQAVDGGGLSQDAAKLRYGQFQAGQLPGQQGGLNMPGGGTGIQTFGGRFDKPMPGGGMPGPGDVNQTPPIFAGGGGGQGVGGGGMSGLKPAQNPGVRSDVYNAGGMVSGAGPGVQAPGGGGLTSAPQGSPMSPPPNFATGGGLQSGPIGGGQFDFQTGGGLQGGGVGDYQTPPIFNIPGMGDGQGLGGGGIASPAGGGAKNAYMALLQRRGLAGQGLIQQY